MKKNKHTKEYTNDEEVIDFIVRTRTSLKPNEASLRSVLRSIPETVASPYTPKRSPFFSFQKLAVGLFVVVVLAAGGTWYSYESSSQKSISTSPDSLSLVSTDSSSISDQDLDQDMKVIDSQMSALDVDTQNLD